MTSVILYKPKYITNASMVYRCCAAFGIGRLIIVKARFQNPERMPREFRLREYKERTELIWLDDIKIDPEKPYTAVEFTPKAEPLETFVHPPGGSYIFGPEDFSIPGNILAKCQRFVRISTPFCINLATAVAITLYDAQAKELLK